mgnify:CR=1 FL=1
MFSIEVWVNQEAIRINCFLRAAQIFTHRDDTTVGNSNVSVKCRFAGSIHDVSTTNHNIMHPSSSLLTYGSARNSSLEVVPVVAFTPS